MFSSTSQNPTTQDDASATTRRIVVGTGAGDVSVNVTGLAGTNYHIRAFATNSNGTVYGETASISTTEFVTLHTAGLMVQSIDLGSGSIQAGRNMCTNCLLQQLKRKMQ